MDKFSESLQANSFSTTLGCLAVAVPAAVAIGYVIGKSQGQRAEEDSQIAERIVQHRRSVFPRDYDPTKKVGRDIIDKMLYNANYAPTHGMTKPWRFIVFSGKALEDLGEFEAALYTQKTPAAKFLQSKVDKIRNNKRLASFVIAICMKRQDTEKIPEMEEIEAVACAVQNMHLIASAYGVGAYWSSGALVYSEEMRSYLGVEGKDKVLGMFYVGWPKKPPVQEKRDDIADKVQWRTG